MYDFSTFTVDLYINFMVLGGVWGFGAAFIFVVVPHTMFNWLRSKTRAYMD